jgi:hypothetical protein
MRIKATGKTETSQSPKERVVVYLDPQIARHLKHERAETDKSMSLIVEESLSKRFKGRPSFVLAT